MLLNSLRPGTYPVCLNEIIVEWYDRVICSVLELESEVYIIKSIVGWDLRKKCGVGVYFLADKSLFESVKSTIGSSWDSAREHIVEYVANYNGLVVISVEDDSTLIAIRQVTWPNVSFPPIQLCDIDAAMNNPNISRLEKIVADS
jgi:hypothetical protein